MDYSSLINGDEPTPVAQPISLGDEQEGWYFINSDEAQGYVRRSYEDNDYSIVDEHKNITIHANQLFLTDEDGAQYVPFEMPRFYDGIDLSTGIIRIFFVRQDDMSGEVTPVNVQVNDNLQKIRFGWIITRDVVSGGGSIDIEIVVRGFIDGQAYEWRTKPAKGKISVLESLNGGSPIQVDPSWMQQIVSEFTQIAQQAVIDAELGLDNYSTKNETEQKFEEIRRELGSYATNEALASVEKTVPNSISLSISSDYKLKAEISSPDGEPLESNEIDLPLETVVQTITYDEVEDVIIITLVNGSSTSIPVASFVEGFVTEEKLGEILSEYSLNKNTYTKSEIEELLNNYITTEGFEEAIDNYYTKEQINLEFAKYSTTEKLMEILANYSTTSEINTLLEEEAKKLSTVATSGSYNDLKDLPDIPSIEGLVSETSLSTLVGDLGEEETIVSYVNTMVNNIDISDRLGDLGTNEEGQPLTVEQYVINKVEEVDVTEQLGDLGTNEDGTTRTVVEYVEKRIEEIDVSDQLVNYYTKEQTNAKIQDELGGYATRGYVDQAVQQAGGNNLTYDIAYDPTIEEGSNFIFYEIENEGQTNEVKTAKQSYRISGGGGTGGGALKVYYVTNSPVVAVSGNEVVLQYKFEGTDSAGEAIGSATATWKIGSRILATEEILSFDDSGELKINTFDVTRYLNVGTQKISLTVVDDSGNQTTKNWQVQVVDVRIESDFDDTQKRTAGQPVTFMYKPYGAIAKTVHIILDGVETRIDYDATVSDITKSIELPAKSHGSYLLEAYITAKVNGNDIRSDSIYKDIIWFNPLASAPVIGTIYQDFTVKQYDTLTIPVTVYDPNSSAPVVDIYVDDNYVMSKTLLETNTFTYDYREPEAGEHTIKLVCGDTTKTLKATVEELGITVNPVTAGLVFDFNPSGRNNDEIGKNWEDRGITMTVSDNFDWVNGGYHPDENGDQYFRVKAGTTATINYKLFANDAKAVGKEFKVVFKTENIKRRNTAFLTCLANGIGLEMKVEEANIYSNENSLYSPYCEDEIIEFEFNINKCKFAENGEVSEGKPIVLTYEDGVANRPMIYTQSSSFWQTDTQNIIIGSPDCDVLIYRMKAYDNELQDNEILSNFIADARNAGEMIDRHNRNQIYNVNGKLDPEVLAKACPDLRIVMIEAPWFTNDKDNKVEGTTVTMRYENGDRYLDNWTCVNARHSGQGTSSNDYGYAGRNLDLIMNDDNSLFTFGDNTTGKTITLTRDSVPVDYLNIKVNIASSENQNNAQFAERYNRFDPFIRTAKLTNSKIKDTMEFHNCVIFIRETNTDITTHREFNDTEWHFYGIGNIGDSKKTDKTRVNNSNDPRECVIELMDFDKPLSEFPTGVEGICPEEQWVPGNTAYDNLYAEYKYKEGKFKSFGNESYEFRYEMKGITDEQRQANIDAWRDFYKFVVTSDDNKFKADFDKYFVKDSALYFYLFTERYTMVDNRAKNSFWHYGKAYFTTEEAKALPGLDAKYINNEQAAFNDGYRWDLTFGYDFDTSLGIDNTGKLVLTYGKEDIDQYSTDGTDTSMIYRAAKSNFFCRIRDLFTTEMQAMFKDRENAGAWDSNGLITQWDDAQTQFPEELWRLDIQRKYVRTFTGNSVDNSKAGQPTQRFLAEMLNGRKKYQRRMFERNQEMYMATKYFGTTATNDKITLRFNNPESYVIRPDFTLKLTPYSDMYLGVQYGNNTPAAPIRAKAGVEYEITRESSSATADITNIFGAKFIQAIGDLSAGYVGDNDLSKAVRLQSISIGNSVPRTVGEINGLVTSVDTNEDGTYEYKFTPVSTGVSTLYKNIKIKSVTSTDETLKVDAFKLEEQGDYHYITLATTEGPIAINASYVFEVEYDAYFNNYMKKLSLGNNSLLEYLDIRNVSGLESAIDLSKCGNLKTINADGAGATGIVFANGGRLQNAKLPKVKTLTLKNLNDLVTFDVAGYENLQSLVIENCPAINSYEILSKADKLEILRLTDVNWDSTYNISDGTVLDRALKMRGIDSTGAERENSIITGNVHIRNIRQSQLNNYKAIWDLLVVTYDYKINQYVAYFTNEGIVVDTQLIDEGMKAVDPISRTENPIAIPTKPNTAALKYEYVGWDPNTFEPMYADKYYSAKYETSPMQYTITYSGLGVQPYSKTVNYGEVVEYPYGSPTYSDAANVYYWFRKWDKSGYANADKTIMAEYDTCSYRDGYFANRELNSLTPVELHMLSSIAGSILDIKATGYPLSKEFILPFGNDYVYDTNDIDNKVLIAEKKDFNGSTDRIDTGELLLDGKKDFVLAVDFKRESDAGGGTLFQCYSMSENGFRLNCPTDSTTLVWGEKTVSLETGSKFNREMIVLRHLAGEKTLHVYFSQKNKSEILYTKLEALQEPTDALSLVFGCRKNGANSYGSYAKGTVYWSKLWYADLGDNACRELAAWPHEEMKMESCSLNGSTPPYTHAGGANALTLLASTLMSEPKEMGANYTNKGGWSAQPLRTYLENRVYNGIKREYKELVKLANVKAGYWDADQHSSSIVDTKVVPGHVFLPAVLEMDKSKTTDIVAAKEVDGTFDIMTENSMRICNTPNGNPAAYWLRSIDRNSSQYFYYVTTSSSIQGAWPVTNTNYIRFMLTI